MSLSGKIGYVDLTESAAEVEAVPSGWRERFSGGRGLNAFLSIRHLQERSVFSGSENALVLGSGMLTGLGLTPLECTGFSGFFPLTGRFGFTAIPGWFGSGLRGAGFDHLLISGKAKYPTLLWIQEGGIEFRSADFLKGKGIPESLETIRKQNRGSDFRAVVIGTAGQKGARFAVAATDDGWTFGKAWAGAALGFKNLEAIVCCGNREIPVKHPRDFLDSLETLIQRCRERGDPHTASRLWARFFPDNAFLEKSPTEARGGRNSKKEKKIWIKAGNRRLPILAVEELAANCLGIGVLELPKNTKTEAALKTLANLARLVSGADLSEKALVDIAFRTFALERLIHIRTAGTKGVLPKESGPPDAAGSEEGYGLSAEARFQEREISTPEKSGWDKRSLLKRRVFKELEIEEVWPLMREKG